VDKEETHTASGSMQGLDVAALAEKADAWDREGVRERAAIIVESGAHGQAQGSRSYTTCASAVLANLRSATRSLSHRPSDALDPTSLTRSAPLHASCHDLVHLGGAPAVVAGTAVFRG